MLLSSTAIPVAVVVGIVTQQTAHPAHAAYGEAASLELPNYIDFLIERSKVVDPDAFLYKGADRDIQLARLANAAKRLGEIPRIAEEKKWSQITGILTGPLGELTQTMTQLSGDSEPAKQAAKKVKTDLYEIGTAAAKKSETGCKAATDASLRDLEAFIKAAV